MSDIIGKYATSKLDGVILTDGAEFFRSIIVFGNEYFVVHIDSAETNRREGMPWIKDFLNFVRLFFSTLISIFSINRCQQIAGLYRAFVFVFLLLLMLLNSLRLLALPLISLCHTTIRLGRHFTEIHGLNHWAGELAHSPIPGFCLVYTNQDF